MWINGWMNGWMVIIGRRYSRSTPGANKDWTYISCWCFNVSQRHDFDVSSHTHQITRKSTHRCAQCILSWNSGNLSKQLLFDSGSSSSFALCISDPVGKVALAFVVTIEVALAKPADAFLKSLALLVARHRLRRVELCWSIWWCYIHDDVRNSRWGFSTSKHSLSAALSGLSFHLLLQEHPA